MLFLHDTGQYAIIAKHSRFELDFADGPTFTDYRAGVGCFLKSLMLDEEMENKFGKSIG